MAQHIYADVVRSLEGQSRFLTKPYNQSCLVRNCTLFHILEKKIYHSSSIHRTDIGNRKILVGVQTISKYTRREKLVLTSQIIAEKFCRNYDFI